MTHTEPKWPHKLTAKDMYHRLFRAGKDLLGHEMPYFFHNLTDDETKEVERRTRRHNLLTGRWFAKIKDTPQ